MFDRLPRQLRYLVPVLAVGVTALLAWVVRVVVRPDWPGQISSPLLLVAVAFSAWRAGLGPGLLAAVLALVALEVIFLPPVGNYSPGWADAPRLVTFLAASLLVSRLTAKRRLAETALHLNQEKLRAGRAIQERLLPQPPPALPGFDIAGASFPSNTVGGDYFDFIPLRGGATGIVVGDVSGHGLGPALLMAETRAYLRALTESHDDIGEILTLTNRLLARDTDECFLTLFFASLDAARHTLVYAGAGHEAYLLESGTGVRRLESTSLPLGVVAELAVPCAHPIDLRPGQILVFCTDGVCEAHSHTGPLFGMERCLDLVRAHRSEPSCEIIRALHQALRAFCRGQPQADDITVVVVKVQPT